MGWLSIDAVDGALKKTRRSLFEPFEFWKWIKLGIIIMLLGGSGGGHFNPGGSQQFSEEDIGRIHTDDISGPMAEFWEQYMEYILAVIGLILLFILLLMYISNVMEFVFVESLVTNVVSFWTYTRKFLRVGFNLFMIRIGMLVAFITLLVIGMLPIILPLLRSPGAADSDVVIPLLVGGILWLLVVIFALAIIFGIIRSFLSLSIPLAMYHNIGIIAAFRKVWANFRADWKQIIVYWIVRFVLGIAAGIVMAIVIIILLLLLLLVLGLMGAGLYFILPAAGLHADSMAFWVVMTSFGLMALTAFIIFILMVIVPVPVFMKYHMLTFLQSWLPEAQIPFLEDRQDMGAAV